MRGQPLPSDLQWLSPHKHMSDHLKDVTQQYVCASRKLPVSRAGKTSVEKKKEERGAWERIEKADKRRGEPEN